MVRASTHPGGRSENGHYNTALGGNRTLRVSEHSESHVLTLGGSPSFSLSGDLPAFESIWLRSST